MHSTDLIPHLFRSEYSKIVSVLCKRFGLEFREAAEDIASETFLTAAQTWALGGIPDEPVAWLYAVAKNKAANALKRERLFATHIAPELRHGADDTYELDLSEQNIVDSQLQMMFAVCDPSIPVEAQIGLSLRILCGFSIDEIASAFLSNKETINKRLFRAKEKLREAKVELEFPSPEELDARLGTVLRTIYLLFNEGYYSQHSDAVVRKDLCIEAMRLCMMLIEYPATDTPQANALMALMCFHTSRFDARIGAEGELILYGDQDDSLWNEALISKGAYFMSCAARGDTISKYHLEASIAYWSTCKEDTPEKWENVLGLYDRLLALEHSPIVALNRTYAVSKVHGTQMAIEEAQRLALMNNRFYHALLGELYAGIDNQQATFHFDRALQIARGESERALLRSRIERLS
ncbi:MAG: RNA polymerase subunit sigma [Bacteroidetes bacterium]|nr:RNA polymerase subunit sigma [Bacteroidota bacterium]